MKWRDVETAPRTGDRFWGKVGDDAIAMLWHEGFNAFVSGWSRMSMARGLTIDGQPYKDHSPQVCRPEGWMPMPAADDDQTAAFLVESEAVEAAALAAELMAFHDACDSRKMGDGAFSIRAEVDPEGIRRDLRATLRRAAAMLRGRHPSTSKARPHA